MKGSKKINIERPKVRIIIATHKKYDMPQDEIYLPVHVGAEGKTDAAGNELNLGYVKDNTGKNISDLNSGFCELTGLYWAWKNLDADYIGLAHYRRHFCSHKKRGKLMDNVLNSNELFPLLDKYKVFVPKKRHYYIETVYSHYKHTHGANHLDITKEIIQEKYPEYMPSFDYVMNRRWNYMFNMCIMQSSLLNDYCQWLFDILFELKKHINTEGMSFFDGRFYGRVSERIFNVWLEQQIKEGNIKKGEIKELPYMYMEKIDWKRKISAFLKAKFLHTKYEGSF